MPKPPILVLDADQGSALAVVRSLADEGFPVAVAASAGGAIAGYSRATNTCLRYPDPMADSEGFLGWVLDQVRRNPYALVIPVTERTLLPLHRARESLASSPVCFAMAPAEALEVALNKARTFERAEALGITIPRKPPDLPRKTTWNASHPGEPPGC